jgi:hypothetical protein
MSTLYQDRLIELTEQEMVFHYYYFPFGDKRVHLDQITAIQVRPAGLLTGSWRIWGTGDFRTWFPLDLMRPSRDRIFIATLRDARPRIGFTVEDGSDLEAIFRERGLLQDSSPK